jgi:hypothetical protein
MIAFNAAGKQWIINEEPNECPICHRAIHPAFIAGIVRRDQPMGEALIEVVFQCPHNECLHAFIGRYRGDYDRSTNDHRLQLVSRTPFSPQPQSFPPDVAAVSKQFVAIANQAAAAEAWRLDQIAGMGYRKALEFLIKDFCISRDPAAAEAIKAKFLGKVIEDHIDDNHIKQCARRATWLGNDETHYVRVWADKDIEDLKALLALTVSWVNTHLLTEKYMKEMPR